MGREEKQKEGEGGEGGWNRGRMRWDEVRGGSGRKGRRGKKQCQEAAGAEVGGGERRR